MASSDLWLWPQLSLQLPNCIAIKVPEVPLGTRRDRITSFYIFNLISLTARLFQEVIVKEGLIIAGLSIISV